MVFYTIFNVAVLVLFGVIARFADKNISEKKEGGYTTQNLVIVAVLAAIAGVINTGVGNLWYLANTSLDLSAAP
jgi:pseudouridine-5'-phosphate glycosidase